METNFLQIECFVIALATFLMSGYLIRTRLLAGSLLNASGGFHVNIFVFFGVGGLLYSLGDPGAELIGYYAVLKGIHDSGWYFLAGYALIFFWSYRDANIRHDRFAAGLVSADFISDSKVIIFMVISLIGYWASTARISEMSVGTFFVIFKYYYYPSLFILLNRARRNNLRSMVAAGVFFLLGIYLAFHSPWRSDLILILFSFEMIRFVRIKSSRKLIFEGLVLGLAVLIVMPFLMIKRDQYKTVGEHPFETFVQSLDFDMVEKYARTSTFFAIRTNALREMGYVQSGLDTGRINYLGGEIYIDGALQMIPRFFWPDKPSYNYITGFYLPRQIGLLDVRDPGTSWGVHSFAELIWNFPAFNLIWFVPLFFFVLGKIDAFTARNFRGNGMSYVINVAFFYLFFQLGGFVNAVTYVIWLPICTWIIFKLSSVAQKKRVSMNAWITR